MLPALLSAVVLSSSMFFPMVQKEARCFYEEAAVGDEVFSEYVIVEGRFIITWIVRDPSGGIVYSSEAGDTQKVFFNALENGRYSFCFENTSGEKKVTFSAHTHSSGYADPGAPGSGGDEEGAEGLAGAEGAVENVVSRLEYILMNLEHAQEVQSWLTAREHVHQGLQDSMAFTMYFTTALQIAGTVGLAGWQLYYLKALFTTSRARRGV